MNRLVLLILFNCILCYSAARTPNDSIELSSPFDFPLLLSGNFGEFRSNHFHAGLDFKTQGVSGKTIYAPADGYISRATVTPGGYGRAIYVEHDNGYTTVYGHLDAFPSEIAARVRARQYADEVFSVDLEFEPGEFPVERGKPLAVAGNSGYSFGPHLHFEVRASGGNELINPMRFYSNSIKDTKPPVAYSILINPYPGSGIVCGKSLSQTRRFVSHCIPDTLEAWGTVGLAINCIDRMDNTNNKYGVYSMQLYVDDSLYFSSRMDGYARTETRLINAWADYPSYHHDKEWYMRSYILDNNPLRILSAGRNRGWINIDEERIYNAEFRLCDYHGNESRYRVTLKGKSDTIPLPADTGAHYLHWFLNNEISYPGMRLTIPGGMLFENAMLDVEEQPASSTLSRRYDLGGTSYPLRYSATLSMQLCDTVDIDTSKLYIRRVTDKGGVNAGGRYSNGWVTADISTLGCYEIAIDTIPPKVTPVNEKRWGRSGVITFAIGDRGRGINTYKGFIDGKFILFEYSSKNGRLTCNLKREKVRRGQHKLRLIVTDNAGNTTETEKTINY